MADPKLTEPPQGQPDKLSKAAARKKWLIENVTSLGFALLIVFMIRSSVVEAFKIPSGSMIPTLFIGDHIFVNKFSYGFKIPFSDLISNDPTYILKRDPPKPGDIIVFKYPRDESFYYIKRVIGVPGDSIEVRNKVLYINGRMIPRDPLPKEQSEKILRNLDDPKYDPSTIELFTEHLNGVDHIIMIDKSKDTFMSENFGPYRVGEDSLFVMGDNRDFSNDSRYWGTVPYRNVKGKAMVIWLSLWISFSEPSTSSFHPTRIGTILK